MNVDDAGLAAFAVVVALLLVGLPFYAGTFSPGYVTNPDDYEHAIEAGPADDVSGGLELDQGTAVEDVTYEYAELSPTAQTLFDRARRAEPSPYVPVVCENYVLVCDGYRRGELPSEFTYGPGPQDEFRYSVIEEGDDRYLLRTGVTESAPSPNFLAGAVWILLRGAMLFHGVAIGAATAARLSDHRMGVSDRTYAALVGLGALFAAVGFLVPYLEMYVGVGSRTLLYASGLAVLLGGASRPVAWLFSR